jgi:hypothetical protein
MKTLRIRDNDEGWLTFDIADILDECEQYKERTWVLWGVVWSPNESCITDDSRNFFVTNCFEQLQSAPDRQVSWSFIELRRCADCVLQTEEAVFLALRRAVQHVPKLRSLDDCTKIADLVIQAFDFTFWEVTTEDEDLLSRLSSRFHNVEFHDKMME